MSTLLVLGDAPCLAEDLAALGEFTGRVMAINRAGLKYLDRIDYWCTYHPDRFNAEKWLKHRERLGGNIDCEKVTDRNVRNISISGSSTLLGVIWGLERFDQIIVAGAPLDHPDYQFYRTGWEGQDKHLAGRVTSLSGWTETFLKSL